MYCTFNFYRMASAMYVMLVQHVPTVATVNDTSLIFRRHVSATLYLHLNCVISFLNALIRGFTQQQTFRSVGICT